MKAQRVIGVDLGGTKILAGVVERDGTVVARHERPTPVESQEALLAGLDAAVEELLDESVAALGFGIPSTIDQRDGTAVASANIPLANLRFRDRFAGRFGLPVGMDNDANAAGIAEWTAGAGRGTQHMIMLTLGTGLGGGLILGGKPYRGAIGAGAELGHMVLAYGGAPCRGGCTGRGHFEALAAGSAADVAAREAFGGDADAHLLVRRANEGDPAAIEVLAEVGRRLGAGLGGLVNIFNPELIVIGGGFAAAADFLLGPALERMRQEAMQPARDLVRVVRAELGVEAGMIGAALVGFEALDVSGSAGNI